MPCIENFKHLPNHRGIQSIEPAKRTHLGAYREEAHKLGMNPVSCWIAKMCCRFY